MRPGQRTAAIGRPFRAVERVVLVTLAACLVNAGLAVQATRRLDGAHPEDLERRYGGLRPLLADVGRAAYLSDARWRFVEARYVLAPVILDPRYVTLEVDRRSIGAFALDVLAADAAVRPPMIVLCDFDDRRALAATLDRLAAEASRVGLGTRVRPLGDGLALVSVGG